MQKVYILQKRSQIKLKQKSIKTEWFSKKGDNYVLDL